MARSERRSADRSRIRQHLLKRVAFLALAAAALLLALPPLLVELGVLGPSPAESLGEAERALAVARAYGARPDDPPVRAAEEELAAVRQRVAEGRGREARQAAARAMDHAVDAQRGALVRRGEARREAQVVVDELDRRVNDLEGLYAAITPGLPKAEVSRLLSRMKRARESSGTLFLAFEEDNHEKVIAGAASARQVLQETEAELKAAAAPRPSS
jgi:hypothetical protein